MFGLHANAEIGYLTVETTVLFQTILEVSGGGGGGEGGGSADDSNMALVDLYIERTPPNLDMIEI